jgi:Phytanoyl-CoA dioxygenase (PhyH)
MLKKILSPIKRTTSNPSYVIMRLLGRFNFIRSLMVRLHHQSFLDVSNPSKKSILPNLNTHGIVDTIKRDGYYAGLELSPDIVTDLVNFASTAICYGNRNPTQGFSYQDKTRILAENPSFLLGAFYNLNVLCPIVKRIEEDPQILAIATHYLKSKPILQGTNMWWSFATNASEKERSKAAQMYHMDLDDYRFIKFFFYLTDVDEHSGPHVIVKGTHNSKKFAHQLKMQRFSDREIVTNYGADRITMLCGSAGYGFIEDTLCFHKGYPPHSQDRLVIQVEFGLRDYGVQHTNIDPNKLKQINLPILN